MVAMRRVRFGRCDQVGAFIGETVLQISAERMTRVLRSALRWMSLQSQADLIGNGRGRTTRGVSGNRVLVATTGWWPSLGSKRVSWLDSWGSLGRLDQVSGGN